MEALDLEDVSQVAGHILDDVLEADHLTLTPPSCSTVHPVLHVLPATAGGEEGIGDRYVFALGKEGLVSLVVSLHELRSRLVVPLNCCVELLARGHLPPPSRDRSTATCFRPTRFWSIAECSLPLSRGNATAQIIG